VTVADPRSSAPPVRTVLGAVLLTLSAAALPLGWFLARTSRPTAAVATTVGCAVLVVRDSMMIRGGALGRLHRFPGISLIVEWLTSGIAVGTGARMLPAALEARAGDAPATQHGERYSRMALQANMIAGAATFVLHTIRLVIYLSPGHGRREQHRCDG